MRKKMTDKHKLMAYALSTDIDLNRERNITQEEIGNILGVSQSTIAQGIKETKLRLEITELEKELSSAKQEILLLNETKKLGLPEDISTEYRRKP